MRLKYDKWTELEDNKESTQREEQEEPNKEKREWHLKALTRVLFL
jgi:hypothetical protein